jgi:hypothetical protein
MGTIIQFPADAATRRSRSITDDVSRDPGTVLILPVIRIEREIDGSTGGRGPQEGAAQGGRRRRRR